MNQQKNILLHAKSISKSYSLESKPIEIFRDLSLEIMKQEYVTIMGASGSGKSTLLTILAALDTPDSGTISFDGKYINDYNEDELSAIRKSDFGFIFQSFHLIPSLSTIENIMFPLELLGVSSKEAKAKAFEMLKKVNLSHRAESFPYQLSGGERQRTSIARALIHNPKILFADEPTGNLDEENSEEVLELLLSLKKEFGTALVVITHENNIAAKSDRILIMEKGVLRPVQQKEEEKIKKESL